MALPSSFNHPVLRNGALVEIMIGPKRIWPGIMMEPRYNDDGWSFTAIGLADEAASCLCFDSGDNTTSIPDVAIDQGIARGMLPWTRPVSLSSVAFAGTAETDGLNYVIDLLNGLATSQGQRWRIGDDMAVRLYDEPTVPKWHLAPGATRIGLADDDYSSDLYLRYKSSAGTYATVHVQDLTASLRRRREVGIDATSLGVVSSGKVADIGNGLIAKGAARYAWTDGVTPARAQLTTPGGQPAFLPNVRAGDMVRSHGVINVAGQIRPHYDWIIGRTELVDGSNTIQLAPVQLAARALGDVLALAVS
jgi:hypothetical protein